MTGGVDAGKSTLVAVLTHGSGGKPLLDNGRGSARTAVARHKHEIESGHTSSISQQALGYSAQGEPGLARLGMGDFCFQPALLPSLQAALFQPELGAFNVLAAGWLSG